MIVLMNRRSSVKDQVHVQHLLSRMGVANCAIAGSAPAMIEAFDFNGGLDRSVIERAPMVERVVDRSEPVLAAGRKPDESTMEIPLGSGATIGGHKLGMIAGPCSVESLEQLLVVAAAVKRAGAVALRGGALKPRTSPYSFQGMGERGLEMLARAREETGLAIVTEVMAGDQVELVAQYADVLQVGSRNMHNSQLLGAVGRQSKPVLLKRGWSATLEEFLLAAEYVMLGGNSNVILCERGIRTHEEYVRNTLALAVVPEIKRISRLPIIVDPSHGTGRRHLVAPMSCAAVACGADGLLIEVHPNPEQAWTDGSQSLCPEEFDVLAGQVRSIAGVIGRGL